MPKQDTDKLIKRVPELFRAEIAIALTVQGCLRSAVSRTAGASQANG
jgi:hypothetical protein